MHKFSKDGTLLHSWGTEGEGSGQFHTPHGVWVDRDYRVYEADRDQTIDNQPNGRIQIFNYGGKLIDEWPGFLSPSSVYIDSENIVYVCELSLVYSSPYKTDPRVLTVQPRISILNIEGKLLARWGEERSESPGKFIAPHFAWCDSHGDLYVAECFEGSKINKFVRRG
jgi:hypothetical protein